MWEDKSVPMVRVASGDLVYNAPAKMLIDERASSAWAETISSPYCGCSVLWLFEELAHTEPLEKNCHVSKFVCVVRSVCGRHRERFNACEDLQPREGLAQ